MTTTANGEILEDNRKEDSCYCRAATGFHFKY